MLTIDDFKLRRIVCELRFPEAYLIFDRAGYIFHALRQKYPTLSQDQASPAFIQMRSDDGVFTLELGQCRVTADLNAARIESFTATCATFFSLVTQTLDIQLFTRVGLRSVYMKRYEDQAAARAELNTLKLLKALGGEPRFGSPEGIRELALKWEGPQIGATVQLKAETAKIDAKLPPEFEFSESELHREHHYLLLDVDYYTIAQVEPSQWDATIWIPQSSRIVKKESNNLLSNI